MEDVKRSPAAYAARIEGYDKEKIKAALRAVWALPEHKGLFAGKKTALLKVNLLSRRPPERAVTTHPVFVRAVIEVLEERGLSLTVADSPGGPYTLGALREVYRVSGMEEAVRGTSAQLNFDLGTEIVRLKDGRLLPVIRPVFTHDMMIDIAKLKTHSYMLYTGAVKNMFGVIPGAHKAAYHALMATPGRFAGLLLDLCEAVRPSFCLLDGIVGMEGDGPSAGEPFAGNLFLAAQDAYTLDMAALYYMKIPVREVLTAKLSRKRGLCPETVRIGRLFGATDESLTREIRLPRSFEKTAKARLFRPLAAISAPYPAVDREKCTGCAECAKSCPQETIVMRGNKAKVLRRQCIKCYCCQELCRFKAIKL